ncbi:AzlD domain-containing protein [Roseateles sp. BYS180W]|uniref:AzlD domain-containing protein n=1 Tax=Roseateles rivi TaxID=3299028 RepID=A0ABW7FWM7_9BURK
MAQEGWTVVTILGMALVSLLSRGFFLLPEREWPIPGWLKEGLRYAPMAALAAIVVPETVLTQGQLLPLWQDPRIYAAAAGAAWFFWRRDILGTIVSGTVVMLALRLGLGW